MPTGLPNGTAVYRKKPGTEPDQLIAIIQGSTGLSLNGKYFRFGEFDLVDLNSSSGFKVSSQSDYSIVDLSKAGDINGDGFDDLLFEEVEFSYNNAKAFVVFGNAGGYDSYNRFEINSLFSNLASSLSNTGDVNR